MNALRNATRGRITEGEVALIRSVVADDGVVDTAARRGVAVGS